MDVQVVEWLSLTVRWLHVIFGVAWIGTSFYFNWLNNQVRPSEVETNPHVAGDLWSIHGGKFYRVVKYKNAPATLPSVLHWFKYEAYLTWVTGFVLLILVYYLTPSSYLVDATVRPLDGWVAVAIAIAILVAGWIAYDLVCRSPLGKSNVLLAVIGLPIFTAIAFGLVHLFGARAAYLHFGALIGTLMAWNVFFVIIPNQKKTVAAMVEGKEPDARWGNAGAQRSLHNNYFTLPVLFIMVSNHYPMTFGHAWNWAILAALSIVGAGVRHWFNLAGQGKKNVWILPAAAVAMVGLALVSAPPSRATFEGEVGFDEARSILDRRCVPCHAAQPSFRTAPDAPLLYQTAPQGIALDTPAGITARANRIHTQLVSGQMPLGNLTGMTDEERAKVIAWVERGARTD